MEWLKSQLASWKVRVALVGGALVVATTYGTCTLDPGVVSDNSNTESSTTEADANETVEVSATTTGTTDEDGVEDNTTGASPPTE